MTLKVALVGTCPSSRLLAPFADPSWEIWACSPDNAGVLPRVTRWFEIHGDLGLSGAEAWEKPYVDWLNQGGFELVINDQCRHIFPRGRALQKDALVAKFGRLFFTSTPAWMLADALMRGAKEIGLYGLDMSSRHEYVIQRPGMHHFIEIAEQQYGVAVHAPLESDIMQPAPLYGYSLTTPMGRRLTVRAQELRQRIAEQDRIIAQATHDRTYLNGALDDVDYTQQIWTGERDPALEGPVRTSEVIDDRKVVSLKGE